MRVRAKLTIRNDAMISARSAAGFSQRDVAKLAGTVVSRIAALERFDYTFKGARRIAQEVAGALNLDEDLVYDQDRAGEAIQHTFCRFGEISLSALPRESDLPQLMATDARCDLNEQVDRLRAELDRLPIREAKMLGMYYGLGGGGPTTLKDIANTFGVTPSRVDQLICRTIRDLRAPYRRKRIEGRCVERAVVDRPRMSTEHLASERKKARPIVPISRTIGAVNEM